MLLSRNTMKSSQNKWYDDFISGFAGETESKSKNINHLIWAVRGQTLINNDPCISTYCPDFEYPCWKADSCSDPHSITTFLSFGRLVMLDVSVPRKQLLMANGISCHLFPHISSLSFPLLFQKLLHIDQEAAKLRPNRRKLFERTWVSSLWTSGSERPNKLIWEILGEGGESRRGWKGRYLGIMKCRVQEICEC